jgi:hypothetical protein
MEDVERREERGVFNEQPAASQIRDQAAAAGVADGTQWLVALGSTSTWVLAGGWRWLVALVAAAGGDVVVPPAQNPKTHQIGARQ